MIKFIKVTGESLSPFFLPGDYVVIGTMVKLFGGIKKGDIVIFIHPEYGQLIKEVKSIHPETLTVEVKGTHPLSVTTAQLGRIPLDSIVGKMLWHFKKPVS